MEAFRDTSNLRKIFSLRKRIRAVSGGTAACKTIGILVWLIDFCQTQEKQVCSVVAESVPHLTLGAIRDFKNIMSANGYWQDAKWNESKHIYTFHTGSILEFISFDKFGKAHGPRRDVLFLNEANNLPYNIADQLITRTRKIVWMDWNPTNEFWFYTNMLNQRDDLDFITLNFYGNEALDETSVKEIESHKGNKQWWQVYGLGELGVIETRIYKDWEFIDEMPHQARYLGAGLDFGYTNDPTAIVDVYYFNGGYILDELAYSKGLLNKDIADILLNRKSPNVLVVADSAEPKSIEEIKQLGVNIIGVSKTKGESKTETFVKWSIGLVQNQRISITKRSLNIIREYRNYLWQKDEKTDKILNEPEHEFSHSMDAVRYKFVQLLGKPKPVQYKPSVPVLPYYGDRDIAF